MNLIIYKETIMSDSSEYEDIENEEMENDSDAEVSRFSLYFGAIPSMLFITQTMIKLVSFCSYKKLLPRV